MCGERINWSNALLLLLSIQLFQISWLFVPRDYSFMGPARPARAKCPHSCDQMKVHREHIEPLNSPTMLINLEIISCLSAARRTSNSAQQAAAQTRFGDWHIDSCFITAACDWKTRREQMLLSVYVYWVCTRVWARPPLCQIVIEKADRAQRCEIEYKKPCL